MRTILYGMSFISGLKSMKLQRTRNGGRTVPNPDTEEWTVSAYMDYIPKKQWVEERCQTCGGTGMCGGGFKSLDDPEPCKVCGGQGWKNKQVFPKEPKPKLPQDLLDHMRKAYLEYKLK